MKVTNIIAGMVVAVATVVAINTAPASAATSTNTNNSNCKVTGVTPITDLFDTGKNFTFSADGKKVTAHFVVTGNSSCTKSVAFATWKSPTKDGHPLKDQTLYDSRVAIYGVGTHSMTLNLPQCSYWQLDLLNNTRATAADGSAAYAWTDGMFDTMLGGNPKCEEPEKPEKPEEPKEEKPVVKAVATPTKLPETGPAAVAATFTGVTASAGVAHAIVRRIRRK